MPDRILVGARNLYHISKAGCFHALLASCQLKPSQQKKNEKKQGIQLTSHVISEDMHGPNKDLHGWR